MITDKSDTFAWQSCGINCCSAEPTESELDLRKTNMTNRNKSIKLKIFPQTNVISQTNCLLIMQTVCMEEKHTLESPLKILLFWKF